MTQTTVQGSGAGCSITDAGSWFRLEVGAGLGPEQIVECYRSMAAKALQERSDRVLVVGFGDRHPHSHLAARDALIALQEIGVPSGFRIAYVARGDAVLNAYTHAEIEARRRGMRARVFEDEAEARRWLLEEERH